MYLKPKYLQYYIKVNIDVIVFQCEVILYIIYLISRDFFLIYSSLFSIALQIYKRQY